MRKELMKVKKKKKKMKMSSSTSNVKKIVGWRNPPRDWEAWVRKLCSVHQSTWKNAGIYEAVMSSIYPIKRQYDLILELASKWCSQTNTFVFPWGEATLTLEDMWVLGGFSVFGISAFSSPENDTESLNIVEQLELARLEIQRSQTKVLHSKWIGKFMGSGGDLENAAFLSVWLSRFVFPAASSSSPIVNKHVFPIAARLYRGIRIALGPVVLATLYKELTALTKRPVDDNVGPTQLFSPFHLFQIWAWERFTKLKPVPDHMYVGVNFPRIARWSIVKISKHSDLKSAIEDSSGKAFSWRPYGNAFAEKDLESFALCMKTAELVGFDSCIETYQPQRVTRQFVLDQDISSDNDVNTNTSMSGNVNLFAPRSPTFQPTITSFYEKWRKQQRLSQAKVKIEFDCSPPPGFGPRVGVTNIDDDNSDDGPLVPKKDSNLVSPQSSNEAMEVVNGLVHETREEKGEFECGPPPGFSSRIEVKNVDDDKSDDGQLVQLQDSHLVSPSFPQMKVKNQVKCGPRPPPGFSLIKVKNVGDDKSDVGESAQPQDSNLVSPHSSNEAMEVVNGLVHETREEQGEVELDTSYDAESYTNERSTDLGLNLEERISRLEKIVYGHIEALEAAMKS